MTPPPGNLSGTERAFSALAGLSFSILALRGGSPLSRIVNAITGAALLARSYAGHCAVKAAVAGESSLSEAMAQQWERMRPSTPSMPGGSSSDAVDASVDDSFPASDPPASHGPDEPPANAEDKWEAARKAGKA